MRIIHTADIHLGSKMDSRFSREISEERKNEVRNTFRRMVEYAVSDGVSVVMLCGDVFDSDSPFKKDKDFFYSIVGNNPDIDFLYLKGNHDIDDKLQEEIPENLKLFSGEWTAYDYGSVTISGIELGAENASSYASSLRLAEDKTNIVMLHGQIDDMGGGDIHLKKLKNKGIDYLALGHIHKPREGVFDDRGRYVYCGCPEGRGFDETGRHGFVELEIENGKMTYKFVPFAERTIEELDADISECKDAYSAYAKIKESVSFNKRNLYRINLVGEIGFDVDRLDTDLEKMLSDFCYFVSVKDKTVKKIDLSVYEKDSSVRGEFVRLVYADPTLDEKEKLLIINSGLLALDGKEIDL